ncbi:Gfo/Idh/MocA family protein [Paenibacillus sp. NPDC057934]|uniref:Gfo/Idh/MocA family protein n=1 Tax=Paenibacillus sp. NPDC057934 TaxID=3346282 RepID=UPI0036DC05A2
MRKLRVGLIGSGWIAMNAHLPVLSVRDDVSVVGICDVDLSKASEAATRFGISFATDKVVELMEKKLDLAIVTTPTNTHISLIEYFLKENVYVLCEKPLGMSSMEIDKLLALPNAYTHLSVGYVNRFRRDVIQFLDEINNVHSCSVVWRRFNGIPRPGSWITTKEISGGGVLMDIGSHMLDLAFECCNMGCYSPSGTLSSSGAIQEKGATWFHSSETKGEVNTEDTAIVKLQDERNRHIELHVSWNDSTCDADYTQIICHSKERTYELRTLFGYSEQRRWPFPEIIIYENEKGIVKREQPYGEKYPSPLEAFINMYDDLITKIQNNDVLSCQIDTGRRVANVIDYIYTENMKNYEK